MFPVSVKYTLAKEQAFEILGRPLGSQPFWIYFQVSSELGRGKLQDCDPVNTFITNMRPPHTPVNAGFHVSAVKCHE